MGAVLAHFQKIQVKSLRFDVDQMIARECVLLFSTAPAIAIRSRAKVARVGGSAPKCERVSRIDLPSASYSFRFGCHFASAWKQSRALRGASPGAGATQA